MKQTRGSWSRVLILCWKKCYVVQIVSKLISYHLLETLLETAQKQSKQECDLENFVYTRSMHEMNADSLRADHN